MVLIIDAAPSAGRDSYRNRSWFLTIVPASTIVHATAHYSWRSTSYPEAVRPGQIEDYNNAADTEEHNEILLISAEQHPLHLQTVISIFCRRRTFIHAWDGGGDMLTVRFNRPLMMDITPCRLWTAASNWTNRNILTASQTIESCRSSPLRKRGTGFAQQFAAYV